MSSKSILKCVALVGIIFPAVYLCTHFLMYNTSEDISIDVYQTFITGSLYTRLCGPERRPYNEPSRTYEGRFTNGKTFVDFIAESLGLPSPPPYMGLSTKDKIKMKTGVNYASGSAGILTESGIALKLYTLGARKFLVFNIGKIGCVPTIVNSVTPKLSTPCVDDVNDMVLLYNNNLPNILRELESALIGSTFVHGDAYNTKQVSSESGQNPCCAVGVDGLCLPGQTPCQDRNAHQYWDGFHPTEVVNHQLASDCFNGSFSCVPINVLQLLQKH
ncbi:hypothetical protein IFM89_033398 [Coptis chinensis]|uniref:GDSL esterase/lipase n=1 Tax=Coptis chinensis TaxID=261450 RepID=A0A835HYQ7_9MAGN|nr:hypothetical protein IFM89_033398 [Coptis chinensis]